MGAILVCTLICVMAIGFFIFAHTKAGKKFFAEN
jgi:hypothetical protein